MEDRIVSYAQNREDVILSAFFLKQKTGFYVDVGAYGPEEHSVTKYFYDRGWHGINIEPSPTLYKTLVEARSRDTNLNIGISDKEGELAFREYEGQGLSTFSDTTKDELSKQRHPLTKKFNDYKVLVKRLETVLGAAKVSEINFLKIDVEGYEYEVIESNDWSKYRPKVLCIEANHIHKDWRPTLERNHYKLAFNDGLNNYYVDERRTDMEFDYINALIGRKITASYDIQLLERLNVVNHRLEYEAKLLRNQNREKDDEIDRLHAYILEKARLRSILKDFALKINAIITMRFTKKLKQRKPYPTIRVNPDETNPAVILRELQQADHEAFLLQPSFFYKTELVLLGWLYWLYRAVRHVTFRSLRAVRRKTLARKQQGQPHGGA